MRRCHNGELELIPSGTTDVAVCCAICHAVLAVGPRTEVFADL